MLKMFVHVSGSDSWTSNAEPHEQTLSTTRLGKCNTHARLGTVVAIALLVYYILLFFLVFFIPDGLVVTAAGCFDNVAERWGIKMDAEVILFLVACIIVVMVVVDMVILLCFAFTRLEDQATKHPQDDPTTVTSR